MHAMTFPRLFSAVKTYIQTRRQRREARRWLGANLDQARRIVATCMYHLNHFARHAQYPTKGAIYELKDHLLEHLTTSGCLVRQELHEQIKPCWSCEGTGEHWTGDLCWKCNGTGIYASILLDYFVFDVDGSVFAWHSPHAHSAEHVQMISNDEVVAYHNGGNHAELDHDLLQLYYLVVWEYLTGHGHIFDRAVVPTVSSTLALIRNTWRTYWPATAYHIRVKVLRALVGDDRALELLDDNIPFS